MLNRIKPHLPLILVLALSLFLRLLWLDAIPPALTDDEMDYVITAKAIWLTGKDTTGTWSPLSFTSKPLSSANPIAELTSLLLSPLIGPTPSSLFFVRFYF